MDIECAASETSFKRKRHTGTTLEWKAISYSVKEPVGKEQKEKIVLHPTSGIARPGDLLAVMGSSGAGELYVIIICASHLSTTTGKSTLLDVLAGRIDSPLLQGTILTNGNAIAHRSLFRRETGYVMQNDALFPLLTVQETIRYAAYLRIGSQYSQSEKDQMVEELIILLRLQTCAHTIIGDADHRGLSGGEIRRVSIAVDVVHFPPILFLDEPTSGLDSTTAYTVMDALKGLAVSQYCTIVMTIHQPSSKLFHLLDQVLFLSHGSVMYHGEVGMLEDYVKRCIAQLPSTIPSLHNLQQGLSHYHPAEEFLDLCDHLYTLKQLELLIDYYYATATTNTITINTITINTITIGDQPTSATNNIWYIEIYYLLSRAWLLQLRTTALFAHRLVTTLFFAMLLGTLFYQTTNYTTFQDTQYHLNYCIITIAFYFFTSLETLPVFLTEKIIFLRECSSGAYQTTSYLIAMTAIALPLQCCLSILYSVITWYCIGLPSHPTGNTVILFHMLVILSVMIAGNSLVIFLSTCVSNGMEGNTIGSAGFAIMFLFSGFYIPTTAIPSYWIWLHYLSLFKYAYESMVVNMIRNGQIYTNEMTSSDILASLHLQYDNNRWIGIGLLWLFIVVFRMGIYVRLVILSQYSSSRK